MWRQTIAWVILTGAVQAAECDGPSLRFIESAPRDRFELSVGAQDLHALTVDLRGSKGRLIFDTAQGGTGVEVFQPLRDEGGINGAAVTDGAEVLTVALREGRAGSQAAFSIDVDDRLRTSDLGQIRVTGGEMAGAAAIFETAQGVILEAVFDAQNLAQACP